MRTDVLEGLQQKKTLCSETFRPGSSVTNQLSALIQVSGLTGWIGLQVAMPSPGSSPSADWLLCCDVTLGWRFVSLPRFMVANTIHGLRSLSLHCAMIWQWLPRRRKYINIDFMLCDADLFSSVLVNEVNLIVRWELRSSSVTYFTIIIDPRNSWMKFVRDDVEMYWLIHVVIWNACSVAHVLFF